MAVINLNTTQTPMTASGLTGTQSFKWIQAPRVYIKAADSTPTPPIAKSNGSLPAGWTDLGVVENSAKVTYTKNIKEVRTGIDDILRAAYVSGKAGELSASLAQFDDVVLSQVTGLTASQIVSSSIYQFAIGQDDIVNKALLLVSQNKLDGKEWQFYHPSAMITFQYTDVQGATEIQMKGDLTAFTYGGLDTVMIQTLFK
jgi:hypothetical protein